MSVVCRLLVRLRFAAIALLGCASIAHAAGEVLLYRGAFVYVVPQVIGDRMLEISGRDAWKHFPALTRFVDADDDGIDDFVAIAIGNDAGYGVQLRYRVRQGDDGARLGLWYWGVIADESGRKVFERFNP